MLRDVASSATGWAAATADSTRGTVYSAALLAAWRVRSAARCAASSTLGGT